MIAALLGALAVGLSLGLLGSGGSILTVPVLVYLVGQEEKVAIAGSLAVVGAIAASGAALAARRRQVDWRSVLWFGLPGMAGTWSGAWLSRFVSGPTQLAVFAGVALVASVFMVRSPAPPHSVGNPPVPRAAAKVALDGLAVGVLTGFVGVGGGFLIVPALVLLGGLPMHLAVGTSLVIIALKSATGFAGYLGVLADLGLRLDLPVLAAFVAVGMVGSFAGQRLGARVPQERLRRGFAVFLVLVAAFILWQNLAAVLGEPGGGSMSLRR